MKTLILLTMLCILPIGVDAEILEELCYYYYEGVYVCTVYPGPDEDFTPYEDWCYDDSIYVCDTALYEKIVAVIEEWMGHLEWTSLRPGFRWRGCDSAVIDSPAAVDEGPIDVDTTYHLVIPTRVHEERIADTLAALMRDVRRTLRDGAVTLDCPIWMHKLDSLSQAWGVER